MLIKLTTDFGGINGKEVSKPQPKNEISKFILTNGMSGTDRQLEGQHVPYSKLPTIIFDEIDTGISGEVALKVGKVMEKIADKKQEEIKNLSIEDLEANLKALKG